MTLTQFYYQSPLELELEKERDRLIQEASTRVGFSMMREQFEAYTLREYITKYVNQGLKAAWWKREQTVKEALELVNSGQVYVKPRSIGSAEGDELSNHRHQAIPQAIRGGQDVYGE